MLIDKLESVTRLAFPKTPNMDPVTHCAPTSDLFFDADSHSQTRPIVCIAMTRIASHRSAKLTRLWSNRAGARWIWTLG